jgi:signal transduction histidine kinase
MNGAKLVTMRLGTAGRRRDNDASDGRRGRRYNDAWRWPLLRQQLPRHFARTHSYRFAISIGMFLADLGHSVAAKKIVSDAAETASTACIRLLTMMSHEVCTPLSGMLGVLHTLRLTVLAPDQTQLVELGLRASGTLTMLESDVPDVARADAGHT